MSPEPFAPPPPPQRGPSLGLVLATVLMFLLLGGGMLAALFSLAVNRPNPQFEDEFDRVVLEEDLDPAVQSRLLKNKYRDIAAAFNAETLGVEGRQRAAFERLFARLDQVARENDDPSFAKLVDRTRHGAESIGGNFWYGGGTSAKDLGERWKYTVPVEADRIELAHIAWEEGEVDAVADTYAWDGDSAMKTRWWLTYDELQDRWLIYDWEVLDYGIRESREMRVLLSAPDALTRSYNEINTIIDSLEWKVLIGQAGVARELLREADRLSVPPGLWGDAALMRGHAWWRLGGFDEAMKWYEQCDDGSVPGAERGKARYYQHHGQWAEALAAIEKYEGMLGRAPDTSLMRAEFLTKLGREGEAIAVWEQILESHPTNVAATQLLLAADSVPPETVDQHLARLAERAGDPENVEAILVTIQEIADGGSAGRMLPLLEQILGHASAEHRAAAHYLIGQIQENRFDYDEAAAHYREAARLATDEEKTAEYRRADWYLGYRRRRITETYERADDKAAVFHYFNYEFERAHNELLVIWARNVLMRLHAEGHADDPYPQAVQGYIALEENDLAAAARLLGAAFDALPEEERYDARDGYFRAMIHSGKAEELYLKLGSEVAFVGAAAAASKFGDAEALEVLVELQRRETVSDPLLPYFEAKLLALRGDYPEALRVLDAVNPIFLELNRWKEEQYVRLEHELLWESERRDELRRRATSELGAFTYLVEQYMAREDWPALESLLAAPEPADMTPAQKIQFRVNMAASRQDDEQLIAALTPWPRAALKEASSWDISELQDQLVAAMLRSGQAEEARVLAESWHEEQNATDPLVMCHIHARDPEAIVKLFHHDREEIANGTWTLIDEPGIRESLMSADFDEFRKEYPPSNYWLRNNGRVVLLGGARAPLTLDTVRKATGEALSEHAVVAPLSEHPQLALADWASGMQGFVVADGERRYVIVHGDRRGSGMAMDALAIRSESLRSAVDDFVSFVYIVETTPIWTESISPDLRRLTAALFTEQTLAMQLPTGPLVPASDGAHGALLSGGPGEKDRWSAYAADHGESYGLLDRAIAGPGMADGSAELARLESTAQQEAEHSRHLQQAIHQAAEDDAFDPQASPLRVAFESHLGPVKETVWLRVREMERGEYGGVIIHGNVEQDSQVYSTITAGMMLELNAYEVTAIE